jgi:hypothetical protein
VEVLRQKRREGRERRRRRRAKLATDKNRSSESQSGVVDSRCNT